MPKNKKIGLVIFLVTLGVVYAGLFAISYYKYSDLRDVETQEVVSPISDASPSTEPSPSPSVEETRVLQFFQSYESRLAGESGTFVEVAKELNLDYRLLPAIAMVESTGGKFTPSCASYNPFGWTSTTSPCRYYRFESFGEAIRIVGEKIGRGKTYYRFQSTKDISDLAQKYNENPEDWVSKVEFFINKI